MKIKSDRFLDYLSAVASVGMNDADMLSKKSHFIVHTEDTEHLDGEAFYWEMLQRTLQDILTITLANKRWHRVKSLKDL